MGQVSQQISQLEEAAYKAAQGPRFSGFARPEVLRLPLHELPQPSFFVGSYYEAVYRVYRLLANKMVLVAEGSLGHKA